MDITQLKYFLETARVLNYTRAAENLYISRQALRQALAGVEKELGVSLFVNERNKLSLTAAGEYLRLSGTDVAKSFDEMMAGLERFTNRSVTVPVAFSLSLFPFMVPETDGMLRRFRERYPGIVLEVSKMTNDQVIHALQAGTIDCGGVVQMPCERPGLRMEALTRYDAIVSYEKNQRLCGLQSITVEDLAGLKCIGMGSLRETMFPIYEECKNKGIELQCEVVPNTIDAFYRLAHEDVVTFDILKEDIPDFTWNNCSRLDGYYWEIGLLCREASPFQREIQIFSRFMAEEYERMKAQQRQSGLSPLSSF